MTNKHIDNVQVVEVALAVLKRYHTNTSPHPLEPIDKIVVLPESLEDQPIVSLSGGGHAIRVQVKKATDKYNAYVFGPHVHPDAIKHGTADNLGHYVIQITNAMLGEFQLL